MELNALPCPTMARRLFILIVTAYCASLLPCSVCFDAQYEICQNSSNCGNITIDYPFGVGNHGCGLPSFQIDCVENSSPEIVIHDLNYAILRFDYYGNYFLAVRLEKCRFLNDPFHIDSEDADIGFNFKGKFNRTIPVYNCGALFSQRTYNIEGRDLRKCNASAYYAVYDSWLPIQGCSMEQVTVDVGKIEWVSNDIERNENCTSCKASGGICGYSISNSTVTNPFVCHCKDGPHTANCSHGINIGVAVGASVGGAMLIGAGLLVGKALYREKE